MANNSYKISLGVDLKTSDIAKRISEYNRNKSNPKVNLGIHLNTKGLSEQIKKIQPPSIIIPLRVNDQTLRNQLSGLNTTPIGVTLRLDDRDALNKVNNLRQQIQSLGNIRINLGGAGNNRGSSGNQNSSNNMNWAYKQMLDIQKKANSLSLKLNNLDTSKSVNEIRELSSQINKLRSDYETLKKTFGSQLSTNQLGNLQAEITETDAKLSAMNAKIADTKNNLANGIKLKINTDVTNNILKVKSDFKQLSNQSGELRQKLNLLNNIKINLKTAAANNDVNSLISNYERYKAVLKEVKAQLEINKRAEKNAFSADILENKKVGMLAETNQWLKNNSAAAKQFGARIKEVQNALANCKTDAQFRKISSDFSTIKKEAKEAGVAAQTFGDRIKTQFSKYAQYISVASVIMYTTQAMRSMFNQVKAIDTAMTELKKVTNETDASYSRFLSNAASKAKELGTTIEGFVASTADFARLGYGFEESQGFAEVANIYAVVGDEIDGVEGATESLISTLAAFRDEVNGISDTDFAMEIIDKFNEVSNNFAISSGGIGEAMERSASSLRAANNTIDESIAMITAANEVTQNPEKVGNAMKTISMRIRGAKTE